MALRRLFLLGGSAGDIHDRVAEEFVPAAGGADARIALLLIGGPGWEGHAAEYIEPWEQRGVTDCRILVPGEDGELDLAEVRAALSDATGIFIGGGSTAVYHRLYAGEPVCSFIRERYGKGVPVAGLSAGALIAPEHCLLRPTPKNPDQPFRIVPGLGLLSGLIVEVHFHDGPGMLPMLLRGMAETRTPRGLGIDTDACAAFEDEQLTRTSGGGVHSVTMTDFATGEHALHAVGHRA